MVLILQIDLKNKLLLAVLKDKGSNEDEPSLCGKMRNGINIGKMGDMDMIICEACSGGIVVSSLQLLAAQVASCVIDPLLI